MSKPRFIAIEEPLSILNYCSNPFIDASVSRPHLIPIKDIRGLECDNESCYLQIGEKKYTVSKWNHSNSYMNLYEYSKSDEVFRASKNNN